MAVVWQKTKFLGVRYREHKERKHGVRFDRCFSIRYKLDGKDKEEVVGWSSEGVTAEKAFNLLSVIRENQRQGKGAQTIADLRSENISQAEQAKHEQLEKERKQITVSDFWENNYLPDAKMNKKASSVKTEIGLYNNWIKPLLGKIALQSVDLAHLEKLMARLKKADRSAATIKYVFAVISQVWNKAVLLDIIEGTCPTRKLKKPKQDNRRMRFLTKEEADRLLEALKARSEDMHDMSLLSLYSGLRAGEIHALKWGDVDIENGTIFIADTKSGKNRHAFMTDKVKKMFEKRNDGQSKLEFVFVATNGKQKRFVSDSFKKTVNELGFNDSGEYTLDENGNEIPVLINDARQKIVFHSLRHTFASWLVQKGTPLYTVAELMGHSTLQMTQRYSHLNPDTLKNAIASLED